MNTFGCKAGRGSQVTGETTSSNRSAAENPTVELP
jgi:hypothetical protein